ncbi:MAG: ABC transporter substrate-binding protein, partial [Chloroflexota bacterium]
MASQRKLTRREFLKLSALGIGSVSGMAVLAACAPAPAPTTAPQPTTAAAPPSPVAVQGTAVPTAAPKPTVAPTAAGPAKIGANLIGKLEGPEVVTDATKIPKQFKESPDLEALVKAGKLPPVKDRIGDDPLVLKPVHEIGKYGGTWRRGFNGPADYWNGVRVAGHDSFLYFDYTGQKLVPLLAKAWELAPDGKSLTVSLRKGVKWSDGKPFTADDIVFFFADVAGNRELTPSPSVELYPDQKAVTVEKIDTYTVRYNFPMSYPFFVRLLGSSQPGTGGQARRGLEANGGYMPAEYMKQFHPKYVSKDNLDKKVQDGKFKNWVALFKYKG